MELSWSTFVLELVNFIVLVWILKHFLYEPVLSIIAKRRSDVEKSLSDANAQHEEAEKLKAQYENRLADWATEKKEAHSTLAREIDEERARRLSELRAALEQERQKAQAADQRRLEDLHEAAEHEALELGAKFATRLLGQSATPDLQAKLLELLLNEIRSLPPEKVPAFSPADGNAAGKIVVTSAFALSEPQRKQLQDALVKMVHAEAPVEFAEDPELLAGLRISVGSAVLGLNLLDELKGFARLSDEAG